MHAISTSSLVRSAMSPANMRGNPSGLAADVYSFGLILWELCTLETVYANLGSRGEDIFTQKVATENVRPCLRSIRSKSLRKIISRCWDASPLNRPTFTEIQRELLEAILASKKKKTMIAASNACKEESSKLGQRTCIDYKHF
jgi:hypothetical protein